MNQNGRLLFPALRWADDTGFDHERDVIELAHGVGVGGFIIFGGAAHAVADLIAALRARSGAPLLIGSDLERGAGQQFPEATQLPPLAALGHVNDPSITRRAGALTARDALGIGVNWLFAPVADVDIEPRNPIVGSRAFGTDPGHVATHVAAWIDGAHAEGALCCAKHFPGHGRTVEDSHEVLPRVTAARNELDADLRPFRAAIAAHVDSVMTAHVAYDAFDSTTAATTSPIIITELLRRELAYDGIVATDALVMEGMLRAGRGSETIAAVLAVQAGCDALLYPGDLEGVLRALERTFDGGLGAERVAQSVRRIDTAAQRASSCANGAWGSPGDREWADDIARRALVTARGTPRIAEHCTLFTVDDDVGGPYPPPSRDPFDRTLRECGIAVSRTDVPVRTSDLVLAIHADIRAWKGAPGLSARAAGIVQTTIDMNPDASIIFFGHPRLTDRVPGSHILAAWGGEAIMQRAAARWLAGTR